MAWAIRVAVSGLLSALALGSGGLAADEAANAARFAYVFNSNGEFAKLEIASWTAQALWSLDRVAELAARVPKGRLDGARLEGLAFQGESQLVTMVVPVDAQVDEDGAKRYQLLTVRLPRMDSLLAERLLPQRIGSAPRLLAAPLGRLWLEHEEPAPPASDRLPRTLHLLDGVGLDDLLTAKSELPADLAKLPAGQDYPALSEKAHFYDPARTEEVYDSGRFLRAAGGGYSARWVDFAGMLTDEQRQRLTAIFPPDAVTGHQGYFLVPVDSRANRALVKATAAVGPARREALLSYDLLASRADALIEVPAGVARLLPDGRILLRELAEPAPGARVARVTNGRLLWLDGRSGQTVARVDSELLAGDFEEAGLLCTTDDGAQALLYGKGGQLLVAEPRAGSVRALPIGFVADRASVCFFASV